MRLCPGEHKFFLTIFHRTPLHAPECDAKQPFADPGSGLAAVGVALERYSSTGIGSMSVDRPARGLASEHISAGRALYRAGNVKLHCVPEIAMSTAVGLSTVMKLLWSHVSSYPNV